MHALYMGTITRTIYWRIANVFRRVGTVTVEQEKIVGVNIDPQVDGQDELRSLLGELIRREYE